VISNPPKYRGIFFIIMPRGQLSKDEIKTYVLKLKQRLYHEHQDYYKKEVADHYLNMVLDKIEEYYR